MTPHIFMRDGAVLQGFDTGEGAPLLFQHGLGGGIAQISENVPDQPGIRRLTLECRAQGGSKPGSARPFSIALFADDALAFCASRGVEHFVAGGISMGAALALRLAVHHPERVQALILARPAWLFEAGPENMRPYAAVAAALRAAPPDEAKAIFARSALAETLRRDAPDNLTSMLGFFERQDPAVTAELLDDIARDGPGVTRAEVAALRMPTLVIGHGVDHAHPLSMAQVLARTIPDAELVEIPPKASDKPAHVAAFRAAVSKFVHRFASPSEPAP